MKCRSTLLFLVIIAQIALLYWVHGATEIMKQEWPHVVKASPARVYVVEQEQFWGPVNAIVPKRCREMDKWQMITNTEDEAQIVQTLSTSPSPVLGTSPSLRVASAAGNPAEYPEDQQPPVQAPVPTFLHARAVQEGPGRPDLSQGISTTAWYDAAPAPTTAWYDAPPQPTQSPLPMPAPALYQSPATVQALMEAHGPSARQLTDDIVVERCNETMRFNGVSHLHRYLSMISLSNHITGGTPTAEELHKGRLRGHHSLLVGIVICMILKYSLKVTDILAECCGHQYVQLWNQGRTTFDKLLESLLLHGASIIFTLAMQMTLCGLFLTFWREDHFIMTYIPGLGFALFFFSLVVFCVFMVFDRLRGWMARCRNAYIYCFWVIWLLWMFLFTVPMIGYCIYSVNFMWSAREMGWLQDQDDIFSKEFVHASVSVARACGGFVAVAVVDMVVILLLDFDEHKPNYGPH